jgi:ABC-type dipeptide/oligopeptide/nickel transport system permease subunit
MQTDRNGAGLIRCGGILLGSFALIALFAPMLSLHAPDAVNLARRLESPSLLYPLGTDTLGRCAASRLIHGSAVTLGAGVIASVLSFVPGLILGLAAGLMGGRVDRILMGLVDAALAFPGLVLAMALAGVMQPSMTSVVLGLSLVGWPWWARLIRGLTMEARQREFVQAGRVIGVGVLRMVTHYIVPQILPPLWVSLAIRTGAMLAAVSGLGYLGLGAQPPTPEWGRMLEESRPHLSRAPWLMLGPGIAVTLAVAGFNLLAEGLRDRLAIRNSSDRPGDD